MAEVSNKQNVEYVDGPRNSTLLFYNNQLYSKHSDYWKCRQCSKLLKLNNKEEVTIEPKHEHLEVSKIEVECLKAIKRMKLEAENDTASYPTVIYDRNIKVLTDKNIQLIRYFWTKKHNDFAVCL